MLLERQRVEGGSPVVSTLSIAITTITEKVTTNRPWQLAAISSSNLRVASTSDSPSERLRYKNRRPAFLNCDAMNQATELIAVKLDTFFGCFDYYCCCLVDCVVKAQEMRN